ncbi:MAG: HAD-IIB family hydrolase [Patescibacteria group bacterium]|nr:HAD-IIB family hydrolase [Patescibacteria group bacterium]
MERLKKLIIFDLDGTLAQSKMLPDGEMTAILCDLLMKTNVAVISGASFKQFKDQFLTTLLMCAEALSRLYIMPANGSSLYQSGQGGWKSVYEELLPKEDRIKIKQAIEQAIATAGIPLPQRVHGELIEDRGSQVTYSACGQDAPLEVKSVWDPDHAKRQRIKKILVSLLPDFEVRIAGTTSIDVTKKGIDKAYGIRKIGEHLDIPIDEMLFVGDAVFPGGNDYSAKELGVETIQVSGPDETKKIIDDLLKKHVNESH